MIETATDCLANITPAGDGVAVVGTTYFHLPQGTLISRGLTTAQPVVHPTVTPSGQPATHITGASSAENAILGGTMVLSIVPALSGYQEWLICPDSWVIQEILCHLIVFL